jgi:hypothetical protein
MSQPPSVPQDPGQDPPPPPPGGGPPPAQPPAALPPRKNTKARVLIIGGVGVLIGLIVGLDLSGNGAASGGGAQPSAAAFPSSGASGAPSAAAPSAAAPSAGAPSGGAPSAGAPSASPTSYDEGCTSNACIATYLDQNLTGLVALDYAVSTKVTCEASTVVYHSAAETYSAYCTVDYSDGTSASGTGNLVTSSDAVTFTPAGA